LKNVVTVVGKEKLGKSGYVKFTAVWDGSDSGYNRTGSMIAKETEVDDVSIGDVFEAVTYYAGKENRFELI
jgi:hypothetical protein